MSHASPQPNPDTTGDRLAFEAAEQSATTPNNAFLGGSIDQNEFNEEYENALMTSMMTRMKSHMAQKMMGAVEQERALMVEQQTFDNPPPQKKSFMSTIMSLSKHGQQAEEGKEGIISPVSTGGLSSVIK